MLNMIPMEIIINNVQLKNAFMKSDIL